MRRYNPWLIAALVTLLVAMALTAIAATRGPTRASPLAEKHAAAARRLGPEQRCTSVRTYDSIKLELFRSAAQTRGSDRDAYDRISAYSAVRMERPLLTSFDDGLGTIRCSGRLSLDLPPGLAVVGGRRTLSADIDYVLQPAADGTGDVVMLEGDAPIMIPLATLTRYDRDSKLAISSADRVVASEPVVPSQAQRRPDFTSQTISSEATSSTRSSTAGTVPKTAVVANRTDSRKPAAAAPLAPRPRDTVPTVKVRPSFNCRYARTNGEKAICNDTALASLDRQMASQYYRTIASADVRQREQLAATRNAFLRRRDRCGSEACIAASYRQRMQEIAAIGNR